MADKTSIKRKADDVKQKVRKKIDNVKKSVKSKSRKDTSETVKDDRLELMFTIVNRSKAEYYNDLLHGFDVNMQLIVLGHGTASADMLAFFGLTDSDKAIIISVIKHTKIKEAFAVLEEKFRTIKNGKGIAYTVPFSGVIGTLIYGFLSNNKKAVKDEKAEKEN